MKRCVICDSTDHYDTFKALGLGTNPITYWVLDKNSSEQRCNRCHESILENQYELETADQAEDTEKGLFEDNFDEMVMPTDIDFITSEEDIYEYLKEITHKNVKIIPEEIGLEDDPSTMSLWEKF